MEKKIVAPLFEIVGLLGLIYALVVYNWKFLPVGLCFVILGTVFDKDEVED